MPDLSKKNMRALIDMSMVSLARVHKYYLQGFGWSVESMDEIKKANAFIENVEALLLKSGYMTQGEIDARHRMFTPQFNDKPPADNVL